MLKYSRILFMHITNWPIFRICFYCLQTPSEGGQTPICDMRSVKTDLLEKRDIVGSLIDEGIRYYRTLPSISTPEGAVYSWEKTFATTDKEKVENDLANFGYSAEWTENNSLKYFYRMTSMKTHPVTHENVSLKIVDVKLMPNNVIIRNKD